MQEYTIDNISGWVANLAEKSKFNQFRVYNIVARHNEKQARENQIIAELKIENFLGGKYVHFVSDDIAVVEFHNTKNDVVYYIPYTKTHPRAAEWFVTFDAALLAAISLKYTGDVTGGKFSAKMLGVRDECED